MSPPTSPISGGILAGGEGRRFGGVDKGWIESRDGFFIACVIGRLANQVDDIVISANRNLDRYRSLGYPVVTDRLGAGPLAGLLGLLESATHAWLLTAPCDALQLPADTAARLLAVQQASDADIVVLRDAFDVHPTVSLLRTGLAADLAAFLQQGGRALQTWQSRHRRAFCELPQRLHNINDAQALRQLECCDG